MSAGGPQARLAALRRAGGAQLDPVRLGMLEALARRAEAQPQAVRRVLSARLEEALSAFEQRLAAAAPAAAAARARPVRAPAASPLAALAAQLREAAAARSAAAAPGEPVLEGELASARRFRQAWGASRTAEQVAQALRRRPANAGPLNSHALVLQSLALMRQLSPDYLRRFVAQLETLQWLEDAREAPQPRRRAPAAGGRKRSPR